jgi:hypothetical protein
MIWCSSFVTVMIKWTKLVRAKNSKKWCFNFELIIIFKIHQIYNFCPNSSRFDANNYFIFTLDLCELSHRKSYSVILVKLI